MPLFNPTEQNYSAVGSTSAPTTTSASFVVIPEMTITFTPQGSQQLIYFTGDFNLITGDSWDFALFLDAVEIANTRRHMELQGTAGALGVNPSIPGTAASTHILLTTLSAGSHTIDVRWARTAGTARAVLTQRVITVGDVF